MSLWTLASPLSQHPAPLLDQSKDVVKRLYSPEALQGPEQLNQALGRKGVQVIPSEGAANREGSLQCKVTLPAAESYLCP
jgi:hypothetical protein